MRLLFCITKTCVFKGTRPGGLSQPHSADSEVAAGGIGRLRGLTVPWRQHSLGRKAQVGRNDAVCLRLDVEQARLSA